VQTAGVPHVDQEGVPEPIVSHREGLVGVDVGEGVGEWVDGCVCMCACIYVPTPSVKQLSQCLFSSGRHSEGYGSSAGPMHLTSLDCSGGEGSWEECHWESATFSPCTAGDAVGVECCKSEQGQWHAQM